ILEVLTAQTAQQRQQVDNLARWKTTGLPQVWVEDHHGRWTHADWGQLLDSLRQSSFWPIDEAAVGEHLEQLKRQYLQREQQARLREEERQRAEKERIAQEQAREAAAREEQEEQLAWLAAQQANTVEGYQRYLARFSGGVHRDQAREGLAVGLR